MTEQMFFELNNSVKMPVLGLGVFQTPPEETAEAVEHALKSGYRHIDTAAAYMNEAGVGEGIRRSGISREEIFIETKVWITDYGYEETLHAFEKSVTKLGVDHIDLLILHQAVPTGFDRTVQAYKALEKLLADGKVRAIGVSNFMSEHLENLIEQTDTVPAVNQIEVHPYFQQRDVVNTNKKYGILTQCWSPIGGITFYPGFENGLPSTLDNETIGGIATKYGKTSAQVMLRWHLHEGRQVIPKSVKPSRSEENFDVFDFELTEEELGAIDALDTGKRGGPEPVDMTFEDFSFPIPEA